VLALIRHAPLVSEGRACGQRQPLALEDAPQEKIEVEAACLDHLILHFITRHFESLATADWEPV
jgi:hypothetical protein